MIKFLRKTGMALCAFGDDHVTDFQDGKGYSGKSSDRDRLLDPLGNFKKYNAEL